LRQYPPVLWDTRVRPPHPPGHACRVRNVKCRPQSTYLGTLSVGVFCTRPPRQREDALNLREDPPVPVGRARAAAAPTGARLLCAECQMSAAVDIFGHIIGGRFLYAAATAEVGCLVFPRVPTGPATHALAAAAPTGARLSCAERQMSAAVDIFGHIIGGRFLTRPPRPR